MSDINVICNDVGICLCSAAIGLGLDVYFVYTVAYVEIVRIPEGATHIRITETRQSNNYLGIMIIIL